ncbi:MAG: hypothetical protein JSS91_05175 [Bacteroidetes bacterium]|nr:hypothetical protein [Bacteroidota bacterium]
MKSNILLLLFITVLTSGVNAQPEADAHKIEFWKWHHSNPSIEISYGVSDIKFSGTDYKFANTGLIELNLGYTYRKKSGFGKNILKYYNSFLFLSFNSTDNSAKKNSNGLNSNLWKFGLGNKSGYGISLGRSASILPYSSTTFNWSNFKYDKADLVTFTGNPDEYYNTLDNIAGVFRFGSSFEGGINLHLTKGFSIQPKYEIADIFPRHLFGKQIMSSAIEYTGYNLLEFFTKRIIRNSPAAGTIVNFILLNAYEYGFYQLRKDKMNWPFTSTAPLRYETFKLGMTFVF